MHSKRASLMLIILLLVLVGGWWLLVWYTQTTPSEEVSANSGTSAQTPQVVTPVAVHYHMDGTTHDYSGTATMAGGCGVLSNGIVATAEHPAHVTLMLLTATQQGCTSEATSTIASFDVSFDSADSAAPVVDSLSINGNAAPYTFLKDSTQ